jgi:hypothetical protein
MLLLLLLWLFVAQSLQVLAAQPGAHQQCG